MQRPGRILGMICQTLVLPGYMSRSFKFFLHLKKKIEVYSIDSSKMKGKFPEALNYDWSFLKLNQAHL